LPVAEPDPLAIHPADAEPGAAPTAHNSATRTSSDRLALAEAAAAIVLEVIATRYRGVEAKGGAACTAWPSAISCSCR
jgi:hypothetical protein